MDNGESSYRRFLDGENDAFGEILDMYRENLIFFINRTVNDLAVAEDIAADIQRIKQTLQAENQPKRPAANAYAPISEAEWEARRTAAIARLKEAGQ